MDALNAIAEALRRRTATRVYGTPFYAQKLQELEQGAQARDLAQQTGEFKLGQEQALAPGELEQQGLRTAGMGLSNDLLTSKSAKLEQESAGYAEAQQAANELKAAQAEAARNKGTALGKAAEARMIEAQARMHNALNPASKAAAPTGSYDLKAGVDESGNPTYAAYDRHSNTFVAPGGAPMGGFKPKPNSETAQTRNRRDQAQVLAEAGQTLLQQLQDPKLRGQIGPARGRAGQLMETIGVLPPEVRNFRTGLKSFSSLLPILHGFRGGTQMASQFEHMVGDINQGPEQLEAAINNILGLAKQVQGASGEASPSAPVKSKYKVTVE